MIFQRHPTYIKPIFRNDDLNIISSHLYHYWNFNNSNSKDSRYTVNGTDTSITYSSGKRINAAVFNGSSSQINLGSTNLLDGAFSLSFWINASSVNYSTIFQLCSDSTGFLVYFDDGNTGAIHLGFRGTSTKIKSTEILSTGNIYHVVITYNAGSKSSAGSFTYYVNGVSKSLTQDGTIGGSSSVIYFGSQGSSLYYNGWIDEISLWNIVLDSTQIGLLYNSGNGNFFDI